MNLYKITNGFTGFSYVRLYVIAANEIRALELATKGFKKDRDEEKYYSKLKIEKMADCSMEYTSEVEN